MDKVWHFPGGLHLPGHKAESTTLPAGQPPLPRYLILPLQQHIGEAAQPLIKVGEQVLKGQLIARAQGYVSASLHAPSSGVVVEIGEQAVPHPSGLNAACIVIETDGEDTGIELHPAKNYREQDPSHLRNLIREAGIVGLGGAGFPTFIKLNPGPGKMIDTLILNGAECEPHITCDDMLMRERPEEIIAGMLIMRHALQARECVIGVEDNKPQAIEALNLALLDLKAQNQIRVITIPTRYPAGGEKQLIQVLTGKEVPSNGLPLHIGVVCQNVGSARAVYRAVQYGEPLISRYVTVTGNGVTTPRNLEVLIGTPMRDLINFCGGEADRLGRLLMGGPMMGFAVNPDLPVIKTTNCLLTDVSDKQMPDQALPCIRCGACADVCPVSLLPQQLYWHAHAKDFVKVQEYNLFDCIECGCCTAVCPSHIPLVQYYRYAKTEIANQEREKRKADVARQRHEFRVQRLEREKVERAARHEQKKAALANLQQQ